jgi:uncharacterized membrane protein YqjE
MDENENAPAGLFETPRRLGATFLTILHNRLELLVVELQQERIRILEAVLFVAVIAGLGFLTVAAVATAVLILTWSKFGVDGLFVVGGLGLIGTLLVCWRLWVRLKSWAFLPGTLNELKKDLECLDNK